MLPPPQVAPRVAQQVELIPVLHDNYIVVLHDGQQAAVVDPAVAGPVIESISSIVNSPPARASMMRIRP